MATPVHKGEEVELRIDSLAYGGNGVGRLDGFVVFVRGGLPGDLVRARATKVNGDSRRRSAPSCSSPGPDRVNAPCRHFSVLRRLSLPNLVPERQLDAKLAAQVRTRISSTSADSSISPLEPIVPARSVYGYRNKLEYSFTPGNDGLVLGFHRAGGSSWTR